MSDKFTRIKLPGQKDFNGLLEWGEQSPQTMIDAVRSYADQLRDQVDAIDAALDGEFQIDVVRGSSVQRHICELQTSSRKTRPDRSPGGQSAFQADEARPLA